MAPAHERVGAATPGTYRELRSAALNALAFLEPLRALAERLTEAEDADVFLAQVESQRQAIVAAAQEAQADLNRILDETEQAEAARAERTKAFDERMEAAAAKVKASVAKAQADYETHVAELDASFKSLKTAADAELAGVRSTIETQRLALREVEQQLAAARDAYAVFQQAAGVKGGV